MHVSGLLDRIRACAMPGGDIECRGTWLKQEGEMRFAPDRPWLPFTAEQWFLGCGIDFRWRAWIRITPLSPARVIDSFENGRGLLTAKLFGFIPVMHSQGPETDRGESLRGLAEIPWRPFVFSESPCFTWESLGTNKLRSSFDDGRTRAAIEFDLDGEGHVLGGAASSRPRLVEKSLIETPWSGTFGKYRKFDRVWVPASSEATWQLPGGSFTYWRGRTIDFRVIN